MSNCARVIQAIAIIYTCIAILYTTSYFLASPLRASLPLLLDLSSANSSVSSLLGALNRQDHFNLHVSHLDSDNDLFLSKAFSNSMHPSKIIPFLYRASGDFQADDITITTLITSNRFPVFARLVERYRGMLTLKSLLQAFLTPILKAPYLSQFTSGTTDQTITSY